MESTDIQLEEGKYVIQVAAIKKNNEESSAMAPYLSNNSIATNESGTTFVTLMLVQEHIITGLQIKNEHGNYIECINSHKDEEASTRYEIFQLSNLQTIHEARVQYEIEHEGRLIKGDEELRLFFDATSLQNVDELDFQ